jgi:3-(3-hydroxy-phenyl)propionate hydroxylase
MTTKGFDCDVVIIGLGPTGLLAAALLGKRGHRVVTIEKHPAVYGLPRAGHVDHEIVRFLQELGEHEPFLADAFPISSYRWYSASRQILIEMQWGGTSPSGFNADYMMYQPVLEDCLVAGVEKTGERVRTMRGYAVVDTVQDENGVTVSLQRCLPDGKGGVDNDGEITHLRAAYVLGADGAGSGTRERLGIAREDLGFNETWLDVDARVKRRLPAVDPHQICDPARPWFISPLGRRHHRFECAILPGESHAEFSKSDKAWELLATVGVGPDDIEIVRQQVYTFEARIAHQWRKGRILLLGDAAHTMPPFMGQGACSGMRDSVNVAWKLDLILRGLAPDSLLDSYQVEREPHTRTWVALSLLTWEVSCTLDVDKAAQRDAMFLTGEAPPMPPFPDLTAGLLDLNDQGEVAGVVGRPFPQRLVTVAGINGLFDDVGGRGFLIVSNTPGAREALDQSHHQALDDLDAKFITISAPRNGLDVVLDIDGFYMDWFAEQGFEAVVVRPDYYIYGVAKKLRDLPRLVDGLIAGLQGAARTDQHHFSAADLTVANG